MPKPKYSCYAVTIRPRYGVNETDFEIINAHIPKCDYYYVITEKDDESRHIHAMFYLSKEQSISDYNKWWFRKYNKPEQKERGIYSYMVKTKVVYNDDFYQIYLQKGDSTKIICSKMPEEDIRKSYYKDVERARKVVDYQMDKLEKLWKEECTQQFFFNKPDTLGLTVGKLDNHTAKLFIEYLMFDIRVIKTIHNAMKFRRLCKIFVAYVNKGSYPFEKKDGVVGDVEQPPVRPDINDRSYSAFHEMQEKGYDGM